MKEEISNEELYNSIIQSIDSISIKEVHKIGGISIIYLLGNPKAKARLYTFFEPSHLYWILREFAKQDRERAELVKIKDIIEAALDA